MNKDLGKNSVGRLVFSLGVPAMLAQIFNILYSVVDRIFVGSIPDTGALALSGIGVCAPILSSLGAFAFMAGIGGSAIAGMSLGSGNRKRAVSSINNAFLMLLVISAVVSIAAVVFRRELLFAFGCSERIYPYAEKYFVIYVCGTVFSLCGVGMNHFILAQGYARQGMFSVIIGALINLILDPVLIFGFDMGISGAALATVISQLASCIYVISFLRRRDIEIRVGFGGYSLSVIKEIVGIGIMSFLITLLDNGILILLNVQLRRFGGEMGDALIACGAIVQSFMSFINCPGQGISSGCGPIFSFNLGAGRMDRVFAAFKWVLVLCCMYIGVLWIMAQACPGIFAELFTDNPEYVSMAGKFISMYTVGLLGIAVQLSFVDGLTAMGKIRYALPLSLFRKAVYVLCVLCIPRILPAEYIFTSGSVSDVFGASFTLLCFFRIIKPRLSGLTNNN